MAKGSCPCCPLASLTTGLRQNLGSNLGSSPWVGLETGEMLNFLPNKWFIRIWAFDSGLLRGAGLCDPWGGAWREQRLLYWGGGDSAASQTSKTEKERYHTLEMNNN